MIAISIGEMRAQRQQLRVLGVIGAAWMNELMSLRRVVRFQRRAAVITAMRSTGTMQSAPPAAMRRS